MTVGILQLVIFIKNSNSLKDKRRVLHSLKERLRNNFNLSIAQIDHEDKWQKTTLAIASIGKDRNNINSILSNIVNFIEKFSGIELIHYETELI
jgi:hypothetical protein